MLDNFLCFYCHLVIFFKINFLSLLVATFVTFAKSLDPDQGGQNVRSDLDLKPLTFWSCSWKYFLKNSILKKVSRWQQKHVSYPTCKELMSLCKLRSGCFNFLLKNVQIFDWEWWTILAFRERQTLYDWEPVNNDFSRQSPDKMPQNAAFHNSLHHCQDRNNHCGRNMISSGNYNLWPLNIGNGLSSYYLIKQNGKLYLSV